MNAETHPSFAARLIEWHGRRGRHDLPWQRERSPYRVWISEIMLQQTQVVTVIPYYERFMRRFPDVNALAAGAADEVLHLWSGLGYYARARNLHRAALRIRAEHGGVFPRAFTEVAGLPGIGRSTAGAILALSWGDRYPILDGNVRRVLSRHFGIEGDPARATTQTALWTLSDRCTPGMQVDVYTQAVMDLGATLCVRRQPRCGDCPLAASCVARRTGRQHELPSARTRRQRSRRHTFMLLALREDGAVYLARRPPAGVWGALWCLPEFASKAAAGAFARGLGGGDEPRALAPIEHAFTHFDLTITPLMARCAGVSGRAGVSGVMDGDDSLWYNPRAPAPVGLPAPVSALLEGFRRRTGSTEDDDDPNGSLCFSQA